MTTRVVPLPPAEVARRVVDGLALVLVCGLLLGIGMTVLPLLPFAVAAAIRPAVRAARALPVEPVRDAVRGLREDALRVLVVAGVTGAAGSVLAVVAANLADAPSGLGPGLAIGLLGPGVVVGAVALDAAIVASIVTSDPAAVLVSAVQLTVAHPIRSLGAASVLGAGILAPALAGSSPLLGLPLAGLALIAAVRVAWPAIAAHLPAEP
jgi:hypothetical protein